MDIPIVFIIFKRPQTTQSVFESIRHARPKQLFVIADGPRSVRPDEPERCAETRAIIDQVDWDCEVLKNYSDTNLGCATRVATGLNWVFDQVEEAIILEDDCLPHPTFFPFCEELLERYRLDDRINSISAQNFAGTHAVTDFSYHFSRYPHCWGWATWRRAWQYFDFELSQWPYVQHENVLSHWFQSDHAIWTWDEIFQSTYEGAIDSWSYRWLLSCWLQDSVSIHPINHLVTNIGIGEGATHTTKSRSVTETPLGKVEFPLLHPPEVASDREADDYVQSKVFNRSYLHLMKVRMLSTLRRRTGT